jgi:hypothetical protein
MERFNALGRGMQLMLVGSVLLLIDLFLPWQKYTGPFADAIEAAGGDLSVTAWHGFGGWVLGILTVVLIAWIVARLAAVEIPIPVSAAMTAGVLAFVILIVAVLKNLVDDYSAWGSYVGIILALVIAAGAWMQIQESGGLETLKSELPSMPAAASAPTAEAPATPPAPPPPEPTPAPEATPTPESMAAPAAEPEPAAPAEPEAPSEADEGEQRA